MGRPGDLRVRNQEGERRSELARALDHYSVEVEDTAVKDLEMICTGVGMAETTQTAAPGTWNARSNFTFHDGHTGLRCIG